MAETGIVQETADTNYFVSEWCKKARIGITKFYSLPPDIAPRQVKVGDRRIIIEGPRQWGERIAVRADSQAANSQAEKK